MQKVFFETFRYKESPRKFMAEVNDNVTLRNVEDKINELHLGAWEFIFIAPKAATFGRGSFQEIKLF